MPYVEEKCEKNILVTVPEKVKQKILELSTIKKLNAAYEEETVLNTKYIETLHVMTSRTEKEMSSFKTQNTALTEAENDPRWPPREELLPTGIEPAPQPVCFDLEATGLEPGSRMLQLAAFHPRAAADTDADASFSRYVLPPPGAAMEPGALRATGLDLRRDAHGHRQLLDVRTGAALATVSEKEALLDFVAWLRALAPTFCDGGGDGGDGGGGGVVLVSHGAIFLDVPILVAAVRDCDLEETFYKVVRGFCDSQAIFQTAAQNQDTFGRLGLSHLYERVLGKPVDHTHRADADAQHLHELLCAYFRTEKLSLAQALLARFAYTSRCMRHLARWKAEWCDAHWQELWETVASVRRLNDFTAGTGVKARRVLVRNLLAAGYNLASLREDWSRGGRDVVLRRIERMKAQLESYLTDTSSLTAEEVAGRVADYFNSAATRGYNFTSPKAAASAAAAAAAPPSSTPPLTPKEAGPPSRRRGRKRRSCCATTTSTTTSTTSTTSTITVTTTTTSTSTTAIPQPTVTRLPSPTPPPTSTINETLCGDSDVHSTDATPPTPDND